MQTVHFDPALAIAVSSRLRRFWQADRENDHDNEDASLYQVPFIEVPGVAESADND
jgi:hypothetical protein